MVRSRGKHTQCRRELYRRGLRHLDLLGRHSPVRRYPIQPRATSLEEIRHPNRRNGHTHQDIPPILTSAPVQNLPLHKDHGTNPRKRQQIPRMPCDRTELALLFLFFTSKAQLESCLLTRLSQLGRVLAEPVGPVYIPRHAIADLLKFGQTIRSEKHQLLDRALNL